MRWTAALIFLGLAGCSTVPSEPGVCAGLRRPVAALKSALVANAAAVPVPVGESGADVVIGFGAGCK